MQSLNRNTNRPSYLVMVILHSVILAIIAISLTSCSFTETETEDLAGIILLWHDWDEEQAAVLTKIIADFKEIHPNARVLVTPIQPDQLQERFEEAVRSALGPDLILGSSRWIKPLADADLIRPIDEQIEEAHLTRYLPTAIETVRYEDKLYGLPESLRSSILYYNTKRIETPAETLDELSLQAEQGEARVAIGTRFVDAFWGIQAFGGHLFDEEKRIILDQGGFANWLAWLRGAQELPNVVLDKDMVALSQLFIQGDVDYLVGNTEMLPELVAALGVDKVGVTTLPVGPIRSAGPFLETDAFLFSTASSNRQTKLAVELAKFMTNSEQATILMRRAGRVPANVQVRVNPKVDVVINSFVAQAKSAVPFYNTHKMDAVLLHGGDAYNKALQGVLSSAETAQTITLAMNNANGFAPLPDVQFQCDQTGTLSLWHSWQDIRSEVVDQIIANFKENCPTIIVQVEVFAQEALFEKLKYSVDQGTGAQPDIVLLPSGWLTGLAAQDLFHELDQRVDGELLQRYNPTPIDAFRYQGRLLGIPITMDLVSLYYNRQLVDDTVTTLNDLLVMAAEGKKVAISTTFDDAYWGIPAFGGTLFDQTGQLVLDQGGFAQWLDWLQDAKGTPGIVLSGDIEANKQQFQSGEVAYYVGRASNLAEFETHLGEENIGVITLPTGPEGETKPFLTSQGFAIYKGASESQIDLALQFVEYATNMENQTLLKQRARLVPANARVDIEQDSPIAEFTKQAQLSIAYPNMPQMKGVEEWGDQAYMLVLGEDQEQIISDTVIINATQVVSEISHLINQANGITLSQEITTTEIITSTGQEE